CASGSSIFSGLSGLKLVCRARGGRSPEGAAAAWRSALVGVSGGGKAGLSVRAGADGAGRSSLTEDGLSAGLAGGAGCGIGGATGLGADAAGCGFAAGGGTGLAGCEIGRAHG